MHLFAIKKVDRIISKLSSSHNSLRFDRENSSKNSLNIFCTLKKTSKSCSKNSNFILDFYILIIKIINSKEPETESEPKRESESETESETDSEYGQNK